MKKRELQELKNRPIAELSRLAREGAEKLRALRFDLAAGKVKNVNELRVLRKNLARMQTFIKQQSEVNGKNKIKSKISTPHS